MANEYDKKIMRSVPVRLAHNPKIIIFRSFIDSLADLDAKWSGRPSEKLLYIYLQIACRAYINSVTDPCGILLQTGHVYLTFQELTEIVGSSRLEVCRTVLNVLVKQGVIEWTRISARTDRKRRYDVTLLDWSSFGSAKASIRHTKPLQSGYLSVPRKIINSLGHRSGRIATIDRYLTLALDCAYSDRYVSAAALSPVFVLPDTTKYCVHIDPVYSDIDMASYFNLGVQQSRNLLDTLIDAGLLRKVNVENRGIYLLTGDIAKYQFGDYHNFSDAEIRAVLRGDYNNIVQTQQREMRDHRRRARRIEEKLPAEAVVLAGNEPLAPNERIQAAQPYIACIKKQNHHTPSGDQFDLNILRKIVSQMLEQYHLQLYQLQDVSCLHVCIPNCLPEATGGHILSITADEVMYLFQFSSDSQNNIIQVLLDDINRYSYVPSGTPPGQTHIPIISADKILIFQKGGEFN